MKQLLFAVSVLLIILGHTDGQEAEERPTFFHQAMLYYEDRTGRQEGFCGGSVIAPKFVLTAAHCFEESAPFDIVVRAGSTNLYYGGQVALVKRIIPHPEYYPHHASSDLALVELETPFNFTETLKPSKLAPKGFEVPEGAVMYISGFGHTRSNVQELNQELMVANAKAHDPEDCVERYYGRDLEADKIICVRVGFSGEDTCQGDSGGPLSYNGFQVGVVSRGIGCGRFGQFAVYAKVASALDWIYSTME